MLRTLAAAQAGGSTRKKKRANVSESDGDGGEYSDDSGDEYGGPSQLVLARRETLALEFFNGCPRDDLMELTGEIFLLLETDTVLMYFTVSRLQPDPSDSRDQAPTLRVGCRFPLSNPKAEGSR